MVGLVAYTGIGPIPHLLRRLTQSDATDARGLQVAQVPTSLPRARAASEDNHLEITR
jgi:hypothetical protein